MLLRTWMMIWKEFLQIKRDPRLLGVVVMMPMMMLVIYGYAINLDVRHAQLAVYDQDHSRASRDLIGAFANSGYFDITVYAGSYDEIADALDRSTARVALIIPVTYSRDLASGRLTPVQVFVDGSDSTTASTVVGYVADIIQQQSAKIALQAVSHMGQGGRGTFTPIDQRTRYWYNAELKSVNFIIPGLIAVILMMLATILTSATVVRERERGTIEPLLTSPVQPAEVILGKLIPYSIIAMCDVLLIIFVSVLIFHVPLRGNPLLVLLLSAFFVVAALGIGLLISTVAPSQQVAMMMASMGVQLPSVLLSGLIFPISSMPPAIRAFTVLIPATHFIRILRGIFLKGSGLGAVLEPGLLLLALGIVVVGLAIARFKTKL